jgi:hypothetical protein
MRTLLLCLAVYSSFLNACITNIEADLWYREFIAQSKIVHQRYIEDGEQPYKLTNFLKERTKINNLLNDGWANNGNANFLCFIKRLWDGSYTGTYFNESWWLFFRMPQIRVTLADLLIQGSNHKIVSVDREVIRSELISYIDQDLFNTKAQAIRALGQLGDNRDLPYLHKLAEAEDPKGYSSVAKTAIKIHQQVRESKK